MSLCIRTPFSFRQVMITMHDRAQIAFADICAPHDDMHVRARGMTDVKVLFYSSMCCAFGRQCADLVDSTLTLWHNYEQWCVKHGVSFDIDAHLSTRQDMDVLLECGDDECLQFEAICKTYHLNPTLLKPVDVISEQPSAMKQVERIVLLPMHNSIHARFVAILQMMYLDRVRTVICTALQQGTLCCKLPLTRSIQGDLRLAENDNWEDAALFLMLSSDDGTLAHLLKQWPMTNGDNTECPELDARKLLHFRALLQTGFPITDVDGVVYALHQNHAYLNLFYKLWVMQHMQDFLLAVKIHSLSQLSAMHRVMNLTNNVFVRFAIQRLDVKCAEFKPMLVWLWQLPNTGLGPIDMQIMFALDAHTVYTLLTLA